MYASASIEYRTTAGTGGALGSFILQLNSLVRSFMNCSRAKEKSVVCATDVLYLLFRKVYDRALRNVMHIVAFIHMFK